MHLSAIPRRRPVPPFINHTPRAFGLQKLGQSHQFSVMFGPTGMAVPVLLPALPAKPARPDVAASGRSSTGGSLSYASSQADVKIQKDALPASSETASAEDNRSPFVDRMMTQTNLLVLPPSNPSYQMAYFLKTTGPVKEPLAKKARSKRISSAMRIFKTSNNRPSESLTAAHMRLNEIISEEKDGPEVEMQPPDDASQTSKKPLLMTEPALPEVVIPKVSKTGQKYFEIETTSKKYGHAKAQKSPEIAESRVSVLVTDQLSTESFQDWVMGFEGSQCDTVSQKDEGPEALRGWPIKRISQTLPHEETARVLDRQTTAPVRPLFLGTKARAETATRDRYVRVIPGITAPLRSHPVTSGPVPSVLPPALPVNKASPKGIGPVKAAAVAQPRPRRMNGHPPVLSKTSSDVSGLRFSYTPQEGVRSVSDSPGPPPPRSPLRLSIPSESLGEMLNKSTPCTSPETCEKIETPINEEQAIRVTKEAAVTYDTREQRDDELPFFLKPGSSGTSSDVFCTNSSEFRVHPSKPLELIDAMVKASQQNTSRRRLRKARPEGPRPFDLNVSNPQASPERDSRPDGYCTSPLSIKRTTSTGEMSENYRVIATTASPSPRISHVRKAPSARGRNSPAHRVKGSRRGRGPVSITPAPSRVSSPSKHGRTVSIIADLPSPPPKKELPPTPHARTARSETVLDVGLARTESIKDLPAPPIGESGHSSVFPSPPSSAKTARFKLQPGENSPSSIEARMDALERRNKLLEAALSAVLKTGGMLNGCPCQASHMPGHECEAAASEPLVARASVRSRVSSGSNGSSALDVYLNTRGK
ncbi:hypothetical protein E4T42_06195 [Aureobasidium subglaciale]|nr:hypothetical protein E4T42_06195 [Aureobasidium subglaciale]